MENIVVRCLLIDHEEKPIGSLFEVDIPSNASVDNLKKKIKNKHSHVLNKVDAAELIVGRWKEPKLFADEGEERLEESIKAVDFSDESKVVEIGPADAFPPYSRQSRDLTCVLVQLQVIRRYKRAISGIKTSYSNESDTSESDTNESDTNELFYTNDTRESKTDAEARGVDTIACAELKAHGYEVEPEKIVADGMVFEPLFKKPSHILTVYRPSDPHKKFIAKKDVRENSNELEILKFIGLIPEKSQHVISLIDSFDGQSGQWAILPKMPSSVWERLIFTPHQLRGGVTRVCWGLIKGLAYLHKLCIAHRDIKPDNLLIDGDFCLKIIDFDIAIQVKDKDEEVSGHRGAKGWEAPEVKNKLPTYSPIKADRWSCGHVILHLLDELEQEDKPLKAAVKDLEADEPGQRPSLLEWHTWVAAPLSVNVAGGSMEVASPTEQHRTEVDGDCAEPPTKKLRC